MISLRHKKILTTGEAARLCGLSQQTIIRQADEGTLKSHRVPGSKFRRIMRNDLDQFMKDNGLPREDETTRNQVRILFVGTDADLTGKLKHFLQSDEKVFAYMDATDVDDLDCMIGMERFDPDAIIVDLSVDWDKALETAKDLETRFRTAVMIGIAKRGQGKPGRLNGKRGFWDTFYKPFDPKLLALRVKRLAETLNGATQ